jgi:hypothetical protein
MKIPNDGVLVDKHHTVHAYDRYTLDTFKIFSRATEPETSNLYKSFLPRLLKRGSFGKLGS